MAVSETKEWQRLSIDLSGIEMEDIELFFQEGARALPELAASCQCNTGACCSSCGPAGGISGD